MHGEQRRLSSRGLVRVLLLVAVLPIIVQPFLAARDGWLPLSDDAIVAVNAHDVLTTNGPLLGMPSTLTATTDLDEDEVGETHHPGPLQFWVLALPARLFDGAPFVFSLGVAAVNLGAVLIMVLLVRKNLGRAGVALFVPLLAVLYWSFGRSVLADPWNPHIALLPLASFFVVAWRVSDGDIKLIPLALFIGSFVVQTHFMFVITVGVVATVATVGLVLRVRARRHDAEQSITHPPWRRTLIWTAVVFVVCWTPAIWDQLTNDPGNLLGLWRGGSEPDAELYSLSYALQFGVRTIATIPLFARGPLSSSSFAALDDDGPPLYSWFVAAFLVGVLIWGAIVAMRQRRTADARLNAVALAALVGVVLTIDRMPLNFGVIARYRAMQMWVVGMFVWFALCWTAYRFVRDRWTVPRLPERPVRLVLLGAIIATLAIDVAVATGPSPTSLETPENVKMTRGIVRDVLPHLDRNQSYLVRSNGRRIYFGGVQDGVFWELLRRGYDVRADPKVIGLKAAHATDSSVRREVYVTVGELNQYQGQRIAQYFTDVDERRKRHAADLVRLRESLEERTPVVTSQGRGTAAINPDSPIGRTLVALLLPDPDLDTVMQEGVLTDASVAGDIDSDSFDARLAERVFREQRALAERELPVSVYILDRAPT
jgi:hypothetical protein